MPRFFVCPNCAKSNQNVPLVTDGNCRICPVCKSVFQTKGYASSA